MIKKYNEALDWLIKTNDSKFDQWDEFMSWLEADAAHTDAYLKLAMREAELLPFINILRHAD